jgi:hypothetical protein
MLREISKKKSTNFYFFFLIEKGTKKQYII